tara:strand:- start:17265 stop:17810 length:546 start_codon:yes stop_codon:yes gene_type:complete
MFIMKYITFAGMLFCSICFSQESNEVFELEAFDSTGNPIEPTEIGTVPRDTIPGRQDPLPPNPIEVKTTYGLDAPEEDAIRILFYQAGLTDGFSNSISNQSDQLSILTAAAAFSIDNSEMNDLANFCNWLLDIEISKDPNEVANEYIAIEERTTLRTLEAYSSLLSVLAPESIDILESKKF